MTLELDDLIGEKGYSENDFRIDLAIMLYERKVASLARAAKLARMPKSAFEQILINKGLLQQNEETQSANNRLLSTLAPNDPLRQALKSPRKDITFEQLMAEQGYEGTDWHKLDEIARQMSIEEPLSLLLAQLNE